MCVKFYWM